MREDLLTEIETEYEQIRAENERLENDRSMILSGNGRSSFTTRCGQS